LKKVGFESKRGSRERPQDRDIAAQAGMSVSCHERTSSGHCGMAARKQTWPYWISSSASASSEVYGAVVYKVNLEGLSRFTFSRCAAVTSGKFLAQINKENNFAEQGFFKPEQGNSNEAGYASISRTLFLGLVNTICSRSRLANEAGEMTDENRIWRRQDE
jgi:hypothetical protein